MTLSKRCPHPSCHELIPLDADDCGAHAKDRPHKCQEGCGTTIYGLHLRCEPCKIRIRRANHREYQATWSRSDNPKPHRQVPTERPPQPVLLTDAEQDEINRAADAANLARFRAHMSQMGLSSEPGRPMSSPVVVLSAEEIKALEGVYQPPQRAGGMMLKPWNIEGT